jgi:hypothetical protein
VLQSRTEVKSNLFLLNKEELQNFLGTLQNCPVDVFSDSLTQFKTRRSQLIEKILGQKITLPHALKVAGITNQLKHFLKKEFSLDDIEQGEQFSLRLCLK